MLLLKFNLITVPTICLLRPPFGPSLIPLLFGPPTGVGLLVRATCVCMFSTTVLIMMGFKKTHLLGHTNQILQARDKYEAIHVLVSDQQMIARIALT